ncbi:UNVERIFIED_CONTAM: hypothetical protein GTU68_021368 [Idotea baltica]|nr:hypothetical protein [Idotea baltica]
MKKIEVFDPAMCCSTGVCGPSPEKDLVAFAGRLEALKETGVEVRRYNLAQEPMAFAQEPAVKAVLDEKGEEGLPLVFVDGVLRFSGSYPSEEELSNQAETKKATTFVKVEEPKVSSSSCCGGDTNCC